MILEQLKAIMVFITWQQKCPVQWHVNQDWCLKCSPIMHQFKGSRACSKDDGCYQESLSRDACR